MSDRPNGAAAEMAADTRPTLDAIAEDLVATPVEPEPVKEAPATPDHPAEADAGTEDDLPVKDTNTEPDPEPVETGEEDAGPEVDFLDELWADDTAPDQPTDEDQQLFRVKIDGQDREVSLGEMKQKMAAEGAYDKRMQEATELRAAAEPYVSEARALHEKLAHVYQHFNQALFAPQVAEPDMALADSDPFAFNQQLAAYNKDQARIQQERSQMEETLQQASNLFQQDQETALKREAEALQARLPGLKKPEARKVFRQKIADIAKAHGFAPEEVASASDHRLLTLAAEAAAYRELKANLAKKTAKAVTKKRPMPSRGDNKPKNARTRKATQMRKAISNARKTGGIDDVALTLII